MLINNNYILIHIGDKFSRVYKAHQLCN